MLFIPSEVIPFIIAVLLIIAFVLFIRAVFRFFKWLFSGIFGIRSDKSAKRGSSGYWLNDAMDKQEIRFQNSAPPTRREAKAHKQTFQERWNESRGLSPTGWKFNEETGLWESPEQQKQKK